jgi:O-acetyl-ADP-ribose deacetylase (regulator of RNase III)
MVNMVKGDVFSSNAHIIAHGCNCKGGFGSGVALAVAKRYPQVRNAYIRKFQTEGWRLGDVQFAPIYDHRSIHKLPTTLVIANCATQKNYLPRGMCHADYDAIRTCMIAVKEYAKARKWTIALPKIGAGLAGGDWRTIKKILDEVFADYDCSVYYLE